MSVLQSTNTKRKLYRTRQVAIGHVLKDLREERGLKQTDIARSAGFKQPDISKLECGERSMRLVEIDSYAHALNMNVGELVKVTLEAMFDCDNSQN